MRQWQGSKARQLSLSAFALAILLASLSSSGEPTTDRRRHLYHPKHQQKHVGDTKSPSEESIIIDSLRLNVTDVTVSIEKDPPCTDILLQPPNERCHHARICDGEYLMQSLLPYAFCLQDTHHSPLQSHPTIKFFFPLLFPVCLLVSTLLLFRLLASTAENYFSPALEMISSEFRIPPPLAGVTLLALGNGSPDVSAVVNAIRANAGEGIPLSLGELTGGGMFVQTVVVGRIVSIGRKTAANQEMGVLCHAELIRDMSMYAIAASYVFWMCEQETVYYRHVIYMFMIYAVYVVVVVAFEVRRYYVSDIDTNESAVSDQDVKLKSSACTSPDDPESFDYTEQSCSQDDEEHATLEISPSRQEAEAAKPAQDRIRDPPGSKHSARIIRVIKIQQERMRKQRNQRRFQPDLVARRLSKKKDDLRPDNMTLYQRTWSVDLFSDALNELGEHLNQVLFVDRCGGKHLSSFERTMLLLESPFVLLRKFVTPLPCEGDYNRAMVAFSLTLSPFWLCAYLAFKLEDFDPFHINSDVIGKTKVQMPLVFWPFCLSAMIGSLVIRYAPSGNNATMALKYNVPVALYGFLIAATWIDVISDQLVNVLEFVGVVLRIPSPIMGMTGEQMRNLIPTLLLLLL